MEGRYKLIVNYFGKDRFKFNEPLKDYTASKVGGPARLFFIAFTASELIKIISMSYELKLPYFLFGTGSKIAISDAGIDRLVIKNRTKNIQTLSVKGKVTKFGVGVEEALVEAESGVSIRGWLEYLHSQGLETADFDDISGSIGGNINFSPSLQNHVKSIKVLNLRSKVEQINVAALRPREHVIISAVFKIKAKI